MRKDVRGLTLIEVLAVIAILGILFVLLIPRINVAGDKAKEAGVKTDFRSYEMSIEQVMMEQSGLPRLSTGTIDIGKSIIEINKVLDGEMIFEGNSAEGNTVKKDPWDRKYLYKFINTNQRDDHAVAVYSLGKDGEANVEGPKNDDYVLVVHYKDGITKACTFGLSNNIGKVLINGGGELTNLAGQLNSIYGCE